jgi:hypothetical protein
MQIEKKMNSSTDADRKEMNSSTDADRKVDEQLY